MAPNANAVNLMPIIIQIMRFYIITSLVSIILIDSQILEHYQSHRLQTSSYINFKFYFNSQRRYALKLDLRHQEAYSIPSTSSGIISPTNSDSPARRRQIEARRDRLSRRERQRNETLRRTPRNPNMPTDPTTAGATAPIAGGGLSPTTTNTLTQTMQAMMAWMQANQAPTTSNPPKLPVRHLFGSGKAFDLQQRCDLSAYEKSCEPLKQKWDGGAVDWPAFILGLKDKARDCRWDVTDSTGITTITQDGKDLNIFTDYHEITKASIKAAFTARTDERAIQNSEAMYHCVKGSLTGSALTTVFDTPGNMPTNDCGVETLYLLTKLSTLSSTRLSNRAINDINTYDPSVRKFDIPNIIRDLAHLFILAGSGKRALDAITKISYLIAIMIKIKQPPSFCRYIERKEDDFEAGILTDYNDFTNDIVIQYNKIKGDDPDNAFKGSLSTVHEDVIAMYTKMRSAQTNSSTGNRSTGNRSTNTNTRNRNQDSTSNAKPPPFLTYRKTSSGPDSQLHKVGDTRTWSNETWYFCDAPHRDDAHWHKHTAEACNIRKKWEASRSSASHTTATAAPATVNPGDTIVVDETATTDSTLTNSSADPKAMICHILSTLGDKGDGISQALLKDALETLPEGI